MRQIAWIGLGLLLLTGCGGGESEQPAGAGDGSASTATPGSAATEAPEPITGDPEQVVAKVGDAKITLSECDMVVNSWKSGRGMGIDPNTPPGLLQKQAVDYLVDQELMLQAAREHGVVPTDEEVAQGIQEVRARFPDEATFEQVLSMQGLTRETFEETFRHDLTVRTFIQGTILDTIQVTEAQARSYYDSHPQEFQSPEVVRARHILVRSDAPSGSDADGDARSRAQTILGRVRGGEDFAAVATETSEDPGSGARGGDLGFFRRGQMVAPFDSVSFALAPGQISDLVKTQFGYHVIKVEERRDAGALGFAEVEPRLMDKLRQDRAGEVIEKFLQERRAATKIEREI